MADFQKVEATQFVKMLHLRKYRLRLRCKSQIMNGIIRQVASEGDIRMIRVISRSTHLLSCS
jgi:hypothetical protein